MKRSKAWKWAAGAGVIVTGLVLLKMSFSHGYRGVMPGPGGGGKRGHLGRGAMEGIRGGGPHPGHGGMDWGAGLSPLLLTAAALIVLTLLLWAYIRMRNRRLSDPVFFAPTPAGSHAEPQVYAGRVLDEWEQRAQESGGRSPSDSSQHDSTLSITSQSIANQPKEDN